MRAKSAVFHPVQPKKPKPPKKAFLNIAVLDGMVVVDDMVYPTRAAADEADTQYEPEHDGVRIGVVELTLK